MGRKPFVMTDELTQTYNSLVQKGKVILDPKQLEALQALSAVSKVLLTPNTHRKKSLLWRKFTWRPNAIHDHSGVYLFGGVGRGKTMMMDMFFSSVATARKRRVHFHSFMLEVHRWIHQWRKVGISRGAGEDPVLALASELSSEIDLLCFDEFEVHDVADALIMRRIFRGLLSHNVRTVMTSNWAPDDLYLHGLQRELFIPFIQYLKQSLKIVSLGDDVDYRLLGLKDKKLYFSPLDSTTTIALEEAYCSLTGGADSTTQELMVEGRPFKISRANQGIAWLTFEELCEQPMGPADYIAIAIKFHTVVMSGIPVMEPEQRNEARRLSVLVDILYDHNVKLVCSAAARPEKLYTSGTHSKEFERTVSRLHEMGTSAYLSRRHRFGTV